MELERKVVHAKSELVAHAVKSDKGIKVHKCSQHALFLFLVILRRVSHIVASMLVILHAPIHKQWFL